MRPFVIVFVTPKTDDRPRMRYVFEPVLVQAFVTQTAVETFDVAVLHGLAGIYEDMVYLLGIRPFIHRIAGELRTVVTEDFFGHPVEQDCLVQEAGDLLSANGSVDFQCQASSGHFINQSEHAKAFFGAGGIADKVHGPSVIGLLQMASVWHTALFMAAAFCLSLQGQPGFLVKPVGLLTMSRL